MLLRNYVVYCVCFFAIIVADFFSRDTALKPEQPFTCKLGERKPAQTPANRPHTPGISAQYTIFNIFLRRKR